MRNLIKDLLLRKISPKRIPGIQKPGGLPQELVDEIISYIHDINTLRSCSITCCMCYIAVFPHLHYSLEIYSMYSEEQIQWSRPFKQLYELDLLPQVKQLITLPRGCYLCPQLLSGRNLRYFSALTNLRELSITCLKFSLFASNTQQYFKHFAPTLQSLALIQPIGSAQQILYFIGFFPNLQDFKLHGFPSTMSVTEDDLALVPPSMPPLSGWLTLISVEGDNFIDRMIALCGGLHFCHVYLHSVSSGQLVLDACVETLETFQLREGSFYGK